MPPRRALARLSILQVHAPAAALFLFALIRGYMQKIAVMGLGRRRRLHCVCVCGGSLFALYLIKCTRKAFFSTNSSFCHHAADALIHTNKYIYTYYIYRNHPPLALPHCVFFHTRSSSSWDFFIFVFWHARFFYARANEGFIAPPPHIYKRNARNDDTVECAY